MSVQIGNCQATKLHHVIVTPTHILNTYLTNANFYHHCSKKKKKKSDLDQCNLNEWIFIICYDKLLPCIATYMCPLCLTYFY